MRPRSRTRSTASTRLGWGTRSTEAGPAAFGGKATGSTSLALKQGGNVLLCDEPTNDVDTETLESLENAVGEFPGCVVVAAHDRWFLDAGRSAMRMALYKHDYATGSSTTATLDPDLLIGEMSFIPAPTAGAEDDGTLIGYGYHRGRDEGQLLLLDAETLESVATVHLPQRVPMGFHGNWSPTA